MTAGRPKSLQTLGFLTIREHAEHGFLGGYLVLNAAARPLEFHCTAPVRPNRAQEILYGPTLRPYLYGEQIGRTLVEKAQSQPLLVCTDVAPALALCQHVPLPVVLVGDAADADAGPPLRVDPAHGSTPPHHLPLTRFALGGNQVAMPAQQHDRDELLERWRQLPGDFDLHEPFARIHQAIEEAQRGAAVKN